jgi:hypothetical protein
VRVDPKVCVEVDEGVAVVVSVGTPVKVAVRVKVLVGVLAGEVGVLLEGQPAAKRIKSPRTRTTDGFLIGIRLLRVG